MDNREKNYDDFHAFLEGGFDKHQLLLDKHGYKFAPLKTFYIGGGTPSLWDEYGANYLGQFLVRNKITLESGCEFTLEVNPGGWTQNGLEAWIEKGVNRFSLGVQSMNVNFLKLLDRIHNLEDVHNTLKYFDELDMNFSVDFMLGLPRSRELKRDVISELKEVLSYDPDHISLYILTTKSNYIHKDLLPDEEWVEEEYMKVSNFLEERGYDHYEVSNFAKKSKESMHNLRYWKTSSVGALGPSATGLLSDAGIRYKWKVNEPVIEIEELTQKDLRLERLYMLLRTNLGFDPKEYFETEKEVETFLELAGSWQERSLAIVKNSIVIVRPKGFLILDSLMDEVFTKLPDSL